MHIGVILWSIFAAWRWGDWKNWQLYHPTLLFMPMANLIYGQLVNDHDFYLWRYHGDFLFSQETADFVYTLIAFPATVLVYLSNYPDTRGKQLLHILKYVLIYISLEYIALQIGALSHCKGWNLGWSLWFNMITFSMLRLHHTRPSWAYAASVIVTVYLLYHFNVPLNDSE